MILLWTEKGGPFVWASTGIHTKVDLAKALIERNREHKEVGVECYTYATNEKAERITYVEIEEMLADFAERQRWLDDGGK